MADRKNILISDDKPEIREFVKEALEAEGYAVTAVCNGEEGLTLADKERPDLIITDIMMPLKSGYHFLQELRMKAGEVKYTPVIVISASHNVKDILDDYEIDGFLAKPFSSKQLLDCVNKVFKK